MIASFESNIARFRDAERLLRADAIEFHLLKPRDSAHPLAAAAYEVWRNGWLATLREVNGGTRIHSDEFSRHAKRSSRSPTSCSQFRATRCCTRTSAALASRSVKAAPASDGALVSDGCARLPALR